MSSSLTQQLQDFGRPDVLVLGAGQAGLTAAVAAASAGARVLILEKRDIIGGSTAMSSGLTAYAGTAEQASLGIHDDIESLRQDILATGQGKSDPALVDVYCREQLDTYQWLKNLGVEYGHVHAASGQSVARSHSTDPGRMVETLLKRAESLGALLLLDVRALELIVSQHTVTGVIVEIHGAIREIEAGAVVLATGGFSQNMELLERFAPHMVNAVHGGAPGSEGDGLLMGWRIGADFRDTPYVKGTYGIYPHPDVRESGTGILAVYKGAIAVNSLGKRYTNEAKPYKALGDDCLAQPTHVTWQVFDATVMAKDDPSVEIYWFSGRLATGLLEVADTIEDLAQRIGVPVTALARTVEDYNAGCRGEQDDEFGRTYLSGEVGQPTPLDTPPYYAHLSTASVLATYCGLTIDTSTRVLNVYGEEIPGLFAAGEVTGGFHGAGYVTGTSVGKSGVFGRIAGASASAFALAHRADAHA
ncbi:MAG: FAD-dependent oxidoreductase [Actinobacteria bacterium]|nr:FAD-dependent oxidoreductase [Actinomycetota bacterium]